MSGFKDDIISILRHTNMFHRESIGLIRGDSLRVKELLDYLGDRKLLADIKVYPITTYDYVVILSEDVSTPNVLKSLAILNTGGIIILEITEKQRKYQEKYLRIGSMSATKLHYEDRYYLVIHAGEDYGH